jgi:hypothetical protein
MASDSGPLLEHRSRAMRILDLTTESPPLVYGDWARPY